MRKKNIIELIGKENWPKFIEWMAHQTVSMYEDGETNFYEWDVRSFVTKMLTGHDRQNDLMTWD